MRARSAPLSLNTSRKDCVPADQDKCAAARAPSNAGIARRLCRLTAPLLLLLLAVGASRELRAQSVEIIVNQDISSVQLDRDLLRAVFTMRLRSWPNGPAVRVFVLPDNDPVSDRFYRERLGMYSYVLRSAWDRMVYTGTGLAPTVVHSEKEMRERVRETPGAIGYVSRGRDSSTNRARRTLLTALADGAQR
jgi:hypothetical protein